ncbi:MAG: sugar phosphate isomerase/epimerase, partial [Bacteroidaceae bacterium]|nr:sugar phosphate isomerase/epimerase [Bacteroidaceae bacterium]
MMPATTSAKKKDIAFQMYSVRSLIGDAGKFAENGDRVLKELASYGYTAIEAANYGDGKLYGLSPEDFKAKVEAAGLKVLSSHTGRNLNGDELKSRDFSNALKWWDECIDAHKRAGFQYIAIPSIGIPKTLKDAQTICDFFNEIGRRGKAAGISIGFHNHTAEFQKIEGKVFFDYLLENTDPQYFFLQMDVYWATRAGASPVEYFKKYPKRFRLLHIKDWAEIGQSGMVGFDAIFNPA